MKTLKLDHELATLILEGRKKSTIRLFDDKDLSLNDEVELIDKVVASDSSTWKVIGRARINEVIQKRLGDLNRSDLGGHEKYQSKDEIITTFRRFYGNQVSLETPVKVLRFSLIPTEGQVASSIVNKSADIKEVKLYTDGGSRGNPGPAASGYVLIGKDDAIVVKKGIYLGHGTNNQAEYQSLKFGLEKALKLGAEQVSVYMDSQLVVRQMQGIYKVKNKDLLPIYMEIRLLVKQLKEVTFTHIPRELNKLADAEVNKALDAVALRGGSLDNA